VLLKRAYTKKEFEQMLIGVPFGKAEVREALEGIGMEVWMSK
jgi:hypothetical protein